MNCVCVCVCDGVQGKKAEMSHCVGHEQISMVFSSPSLPLPLPLPPTPPPSPYPSSHLTSATYGSSCSADMYRTPAEACPLALEGHAAGETQGGQEEGWRGLCVCVCVCVLACVV